MLTVAKRQVFSRKAPTHPVKPIMNVTVPKNSPFKSLKIQIKTARKSPMHIKMKAGSKATFATFPKLLKMSFSLQAQTPTVKIPRPNN